jgi:signal transduction histidine kinase
MVEAKARGQVTLGEFMIPQPDHARWLLAQVSDVLSSSPDDKEALQSVARLAVPALGTRCVIDLVDRDGRIYTAAVAADTAAVEDALREELAHTPSERLPGALAVYSGQSHILPGPDEQSRTSGHGAQHAEPLHRFGGSSSMSVPLLARGGALGAVTFAHHRPQRYGPSDLAIAEDLARRLALVVDNARMYDDLQQALQTRDEFLSRAVHDLKNPLTTARAQSQLLRGWALKEQHTPEKLGHGFDRLDAAITKIARMIDELRDVTNLEAGRALQLRIEPVDLVAVARASVAEYALASRRHAVRLETNLVALVGHWDAGRIDRVLSNLLDNALKYSPQGGEIVVAVERCEDEARVSVRDRGIGVPAHDLPHIFKRHHQASNVVRRGVGNGIGLAGVRAIVEQHGGRVEVQSEEGAGSRFRISLPLRWGGAAESA